MKYNSYKEYFDSITKKLTKKYLIKKFEKYYILLKQYEDDGDDIDELIENRDKIFNFLYKFYPSLNYSPSGSMY